MLSFKLLSGSAIPKKNFDLAYERGQLQVNQFRFCLFGRICRSLFCSQGRGGEAVFKLNSQCSFILAHSKSVEFIAYCIINSPF